MSFLVHEMKRILGYTLFWFAMGMLVMLVLANEWIGILIVAVSLLISYYIFSC